MRIARIRSLVLTAAVPVVLAAATALGQVRVGEDGRAMDANPRVGSAGYNDAPPPSFFNNNANRIVTGNVTGFNQFRDRVQAPDPREFRQPLGSASIDDFLRRSAAPPRAYQAPSNPFESQPFYGQQVAAPARLPDEFVRQTATGTYIYTPQTPQLNQSGIQGTSNLIDSRLMSLQPGDFLVPGPVDPRTNLPTMIMASPLLGIRSMDLGNPSDMNFLQTFSGARDEAALARLHLDPRTLDLMRNELMATTPPGAIDTQIAPANPGAVQKPFEAPKDGALTTEPLNSAISADPLANQVRAEGGQGRRFIASPRRQSTQYQALEDQLQRYYQNQLQNDQTRHQEFLRQLKANEARQGGAGAGAIDYNRFAAGVMAGGAPAGAAKPAPKKVASLAEGVKAEGLATLLRRGEDLMKEGKYASAIQQFNAALQVAPNNGLVHVGQAHAELGAGLYQRAEEHLRAAYGRDPVLTMAQFDLRSVISQQRLETIVRELKEAARGDEKDAGALFLLAYVAYNSGSPEQAKVFLDLAEKRAAANKGVDRTLRLLQTHWALDGAGPATRPAGAPAQNKPAAPAPRTTPDADASK